MEALSVARKVVRVFAWIFLCFLGLFLLTYILIQVPAVQDFARGKVVAYLHNKFKTEVRIGKLSVTFPRRVVLENVYFGDQKGDTLLAGEKIRLDIALLKLLSSKVEINYVELDGIRTNIYRRYPDTTFNFDYIVKAFASPADTTTASDTTGQMKFRVDKVVLNRVVTTYHDDEIGSDMYINIGSFSSDIDKMDPYRFIYSIPSINLNNTAIRMKQYKPLVQPRSMAVVEAQNHPPQFDLSFKTINFNNVQFNYDNEVSAISADLNMGQMLADARSVNLDSMVVDLNKLQLNNTTTKIIFGKSQQAAIAVKEVGKNIKAQANNPWKIRVSNVSFANDVVQYDDNNQPRVSFGWDYAHMNIQDLAMQAKEAIFSPATIQASIQSAAFNEQKSGTILKQLQTDLVFDDKHTALENLYLQTNRTVLKRRVLLTYESIASMAARPGDIYIEADVDRSTVAVRDVLTFAPALRAVPPFKGNEGEIFNINAVVRGYIKDLSIPNLNVSGFRNTSLAMSGRIKGLPSTNAYFDLNINRLNTTKSDLATFLPKGSIPNTIRLPESISATGNFRGTPFVYNTHVIAQTNKGNVDLIANMNGDRYKMKASGSNLDLGYILINPNLGRATFHADISGNGFDYKKSPIDINAYISSAYINGYTYHNAKFVGNLRNGILTGKGDVKDTNADLDFAVTSDLKLASPSLDLKLSVDSLNLKALGFSSVPFKLHGDINLNMPSLNMASLQGNGTITDVVFVKNGQRYTIDTITIAATPTSIALTSEVGIANLKGTYNLTEIAVAVENIINQYYKIPDYKPQPLTTQQNWDLTATIFPSPVLFAFMPDMKGSDTITLAAGLNTAQNDLHLLARTRKLNFAGQSIDSLTLNAATTGNQLGYSVTALSAGSKSFKVYRTSVTGNVMNDLLSINLDVKDRNNKSRYQVNGIAASIPGGYKFSLGQDSVMFDYDRWSVGAGNYIQSTDAGLIVHNFTISKGNQMLSANSRTTIPNSPVDLRFSNFEISTITRIADQEQLLMGGTINGTAVVSNFNTNPVFTSDLRVDNFNYKGDTLGNIAAKINNQTANTLAADITLSGAKNDVHLAGSYFISSQTVDMNLDMRRFDLSSVKPFLTDQLRDIGGALTGRMAVKGKLSAPELNGNLRFDSAFIAPALLGERFTLPNQDLKITPQGIRLDHFVIKDSAGGEAMIDGSIATTDFSDYEYDFYLTASNFRIMNTTKTANSQYWGKLNVDVDLSVYGNMKSPTLEGNLRVNKETNFYAVLPGSNPEIVSREGVVKFVDMDNASDSIFATSTNIFDTMLSKMDVGGLDLAATIETDTSAQFNLIVNDLTGDMLSMRGRADLAAGIDRSGKISLTGNFELNSGAYELTFEFLRRRFEIIRGSMVTWTGDPTQAIVNVTARYIANSSPINLVAPQLTESTTEINRFKQRLPFNVMLYLNGQIMEPTISYDIILPEGYAAAWKEVDEKLTQIRRDQAELSKQVFALLLLNRFVQDNPFQDAGAGVTIASMARQSLGQLLTSELNQWANSLIPGFGLTFGIESMEDYTTGELRNRTDLTVAITRNLFNDRVRITIGSNFELEGPANTGVTPGAPASGFASDVAIDYLVSKDGRYILRAYRRNAYEVLVEGQAVETGLRFILTMDYDRFRELFQRRKKEPAALPRRRTSTNTSEQVPDKTVQENKQ
jgi:translocation and assembly module TamB